VGPPVLHQLWPTTAARQFSLGYSRTAERASNSEILGGPTNSEELSAPARDILPLSSGEFVVLRNREDVRSAGTVIALVGQRADRYDAAGRHLATATFKTQVRWIVAASSTSVTGLDRQNRIATAAWAAAIPGEVLRP
jgi:hypothetical protein